MSFLPGYYAMPVYISAAFCIVFVASFFAATCFLGGILNEMKRAAFNGYRVQIVKSDKNEKSN